MNPLLLAGIIQGAGSIIGGISAKNTADLNAFNIETERKLSEAQAKERSRMRIQAYESNLSANMASFAAQGRDISSSMSVKAFLDKQKEVASQDVRAVQNDSFMRSVQYKSQASAERATGRAKMVRSLFDAGSSIVQGRYYAQKTGT